MSKFLVFGAGGQLGQELVARLSGDVEIIGLDRQAADITDFDRVMSAITRIAPTIIINAAAFTAVDRAESEPQKARSINTIGAQILASAAGEFGLPIVHVSTDYVFDGQKPSSYVETDPTAPLNIYGATKLDGELAVQAANPRHVILRTSWTYGVYGRNFLKTILKLASEQSDLRIVADQHGCPTATADLSTMILYASLALERGDAPYGLYHAAGEGETTWYSFAQAILDFASPYLPQRPRLIPITTAEYPTPARRPANSVLNSTLFQQTFGYRAVNWRARVSEVVSELLGRV